MQNEVKSYYTKAPKESLIKLKELEAIIGSVLKDYQIVLSYGVPTFVFEGKKIAGIAGYKEFVSLYPLGHELIEKYQNDLKNYKTSSGAIQFPLDQPLPKEIINNIIRDRIKITQ
jgi:uncharacterized protein YdhG (YjbR/CyaY superfamily)